MAGFRIYEGCSGRHTFQLRFCVRKAFVHGGKVVGDQLLVLGGQMRFEGGLGFIQFDIGESGQQRADHDHVEQAAVAGLFGDLVAGHEDDVMSFALGRGPPWTG